MRVVKYLLNGCILMYTTDIFYLLLLLYIYITDHCVAFIRVSYKKTKTICMYIVYLY